ncbi:hypothetical protein [Neobacillus niacini]|uniref:hypothetical protein n=2 Tax=Neobacillus niacini TaxID=86668 RepID=UPI002FFE002D
MKIDQLLERGEMMKEENKERKINSEQKANKLFEGLYGMDPEMSLLSANFAPPENTYLKEHYQDDHNENE